MSVLFTFLTGSRLQLLKEQLQKQMKVKRAEVRKIQESQRKLDNEEMSEEEEEEMTDEEGMTLKIICVLIYPYLLLVVIIDSLLENLCG